MRPAPVLAVIAAAAILALGAIALASSRQGPGGSPGPDQRQLVLAPIDDIDVLIRESMPPKVTLRITAGLPGGCARQDSYDWGRSGDTINVTVRNSMPVGNPVCTMIYGQYDVTIDLGSSFEVGKTYTVQVNDKRATFKT